MALGLADHEFEREIGDILFASSNTLSDLRRMIAELAAGQIPDLPVEDEDDY